MKLDPNSYLRTLNALKPTILERPSSMWELSVFYHIPLLAMVLYSMRPDVLGPSQDLTDTAARLVAFYRSTQVDDWRD